MKRKTTAKQARTTPPLQVAHYLCHYLQQPMLKSVLRSRIAPEVSSANPLIVALPAVPLPADRYRVATLLLISNWYVDTNISSVGLRWYIVKLGTDAYQGAVVLGTGRVCHIRRTRVLGHVDKGLLSTGSFVVFLSWVCGTASLITCSSARSVRCESRSLFLS